MIDITFGNTVAKSFAALIPLPEDERIFQQFGLLLCNAKVKAVSGGLSEWYRFLKEPTAKEAEKAVLRSRTFTERPIFLDMTLDEGSPHDYALYRDYVWTLDEQFRFGYEYEALRQCLEQEWQRLNSQSYPLTVEERAQPS